MRALLFVLAVSSLVGCAAADPGLDVLDDTAVTAADADLGAADSAVATITHYVGRRDERRCRWPLCGGYWVHRANRTTTRCDDGHNRAECYVSSIDTSTTGLAAEQIDALESAFASGRAVIEGTIARADAGEFGTYALLRANQGWVAATDAPIDGIFYSVMDNGIRCVRAPCFSLAEQKLNSTLDRTLSEVDLDDVGLTDEQRTSVGAALSGAGLLATGSNLRNRRTGAVKLVATQAFLPLEPLPTTCTTAADCAFSLYPRLVESEADCYCPGRPGAILSTSTASYEAAWQFFCGATFGRDVCPIISYARPLGPTCTAEGLCVVGVPAP